MPLGRKVFVIHGRDKRARREFFTFLRAIGLSPIEWSEALAEAGGGAPMIGDVLDKVIRPDRAVIVLLTPDDVVHLKPEHADDADDPELELSGQARPNVLFEAGMAFGRHPEHTVLVEFGKVRKFTDIAGRFIVRLDGSAESRTKLANQLKAIGCEVSTDGTDWLAAGDLTPPQTRRAPRARAEARSPDRKSTTSATGLEQPKFTNETGTWDVEMGNFTVRTRRFGGLVVHGEIVNHQSGALTLALKATFYDAHGKILGSADGIVHQIRGGERRTFELSTSEEIEIYTRVHVHVDTGIKR